MTSIDRRQALTLAFGAGLSPAAGLGNASTTTFNDTTPLRFPLRLGFNENPWGPGPKAREAVAAAINDGCRYGVDYAMRLIAAIATRENVPGERVCLGSGSGELLHMLALGWGARSTVTCAWPTFGQLMSFAEKQGATIRRVPLDAQLRHDAGGISAATPAGTGLVYLCNPNNPTGTVLPGSALRELCLELAARTLVVVDEAYIDLVDLGVTESMIDLARGDTNLVVLRTFSKVHGLAGLRIGYAIGRPDLIKKLRALEMVSPNVLGLAAATASLGDTEFIAQSREHIIADRRRVTAVCRELGMECSNSQGNFLFVRTGVPIAEFGAQMKTRGIDVGRPFEPLTDWCRISLGRTAENTSLINALKDFKGARS